MKEKLKTAIVLGATGLTGNHLVKLLLEDNRYDKIKLFSRSSIGLKNQKIEEYLGDILHLSDFQKAFTGDEVYCCIGTTKAKTPDKEMYKKIDYGIPIGAAELSVKNGIGTFIVISALGANADSKIFYNRTKGEMEKAVLELSIKRIYILQPSLIGGNRKEKRFGEGVFKGVMKIMNIFMVGSLKKYKSIHPKQIAKSMIWLANNSYETHRIESNFIQKLGS